MLKVAQQNTIPLNKLSKNINYPFLTEAHSRKRENIATRSRYRRSDSDSERILNNNNELSKIIVSKKDISEKKKMITELLNKGADVNFKDANRKDNTPLHLSVKKDELEIVNFLLTKGADRTIKNGEGKTPIELANSFEKPNQNIITALGFAIPGNSQSDSMVNRQPLQHSQSTQENERTSPKRPIAGTEELSAKRGKPMRPIESAFQEARGGKRQGSSEDLDVPVKKVSKFENHPGTHSSSIVVEMQSGEYLASGIKSTLHGTIYQLKLLMLFLKKGLDRGYEFSLATEMDAAEKFDDLVFEYKKAANDEKSYIFLQAKHKQKLEDKDKIHIGDLLSTDKSNPFMLIKYFLSFIKIRKTFGEKGDFFIFTNTNFDFIDGTLNIISPTRGSNKDISLSLTDASGDCVLKELLGIDNGKFYKINDNFSGSFKNLLEKKPSDKDKKSYFFESLEEIRELIQKDGRNLDEEIKAFFQNLVFAVKQPNEKELDIIFKGGSEERLSLLNADLLTSSFEKKMMNWFKAKKGNWYTKEMAEKLFESIDSEINSIISIGYGRAYYEELIDYGIDFKNNPLENIIHSEKKFFQL